MASPVLDRVRALIAPIASDLHLDIYDVEQRGGTLRITLDTPAGSEGGVDLEQLALATRLISRELDHHDPVPGKYTLEVSSPGVERALRSPEHFARVVGQQVSVRLADVTAEQRRIDGIVVDVDAAAGVVTVQPDSGEPRPIVIAGIDRAKTIFKWEATPKPGKTAGKTAGKAASKTVGKRAAATKSSIEQTQTEPTAVSAESEPS